MALFVDGPACTINDLVDEDSGLLDVAESDRINVSTKLQLATQEIDLELRILLGTTATIGQVVVTPALKQWVRMLALTMVYRDAFFSQVVDRYERKWNEYVRLARCARDRFTTLGVGTVADPLSVAEPPVLGTVAGSPEQAGGTFYACVAWVNGAGQEGAASPAESMQVLDGFLMTVTAVNPPANATGFDVFAGSSLNDMVRQNDTALPPGGSFTYLPGASARTERPGSGQDPDTVTPLSTGQRL